MNTQNQSIRTYPLTGDGTGLAQAGEKGATDSVAQKIETGRAVLVVTAYPWGVEFDVIEREEGPR